MKNLLHLFILGFVMVACTDLDSLEPFQKDTFIKYYGDPGNTEAVDLEITDQGYAILALNSDGNLKSGRLFTTDFFGNNVLSSRGSEWENFIPSDLLWIGDGYLVIGDSINGNETLSKMKILRTDQQLNVTHEFVSAIPQSHGTAINLRTSSTIEAISLGYVEDAEGSFIVLHGNSLTNLDSLWQQSSSLQNGKKYITGTDLYQNDSNGDEFVFLQIDNADVLNPQLESVFIDGFNVVDAALPIYESNNLVGTNGDFRKVDDHYFAAYTINISTINGLRKRVGLVSSQYPGLVDTVEVGVFSVFDFVAKTIINR